MTESVNAEGGAAPPPIAVLTREECRDILARHRLCTMSLVDGGEPYAIPLFYGFDGTTLHLGLSEGRKTAVLDVNPRVCITVVALGEGDAWASVQVTGVARVVRDEAERRASVETLMAHNRRIREQERERGARAAAEHAAAPRRHGSGRIIRIDDATITGRARR